MINNRLVKLAERRKNDLPLCSDISGSYHFKTDKKQLVPVMYKKLAGCKNIHSIRMAYHLNNLWINHRDYFVSESDCITLSNGDILFTYNNQNYAFPLPEVDGIVYIRRYNGQ